MLAKFNLCRGILLACAVSAVSTAPALAQDAIIVQGERIETADVRSTAREITVGSHSRQTPLSRWQRPICPGVWGMTEENAQAVLDRIVFNAIEAGVPAAQEAGCGANIWVIVVDDVDATFERLNEDDSFLTRHLTRFQERQIRQQDSFALGWNLITTRNPETGLRIPTGFEALALSGPPDNEVNGLSRLALGIRTDIELSVVLVERAALGDLDAHALADYATMRLLAYTNPPSREDAVSTVLTLFERGSDATAPDRMTAFDRAYLRALYRSSEVRPAHIAIGNISGGMEDIEIP